MGKLQRYWSKVTPFRKFQADVSDPAQFVGKTIWARKQLDSADEEIVIKDVKGCIALRAEENYLLRYFQINGTHFCSMFSFYVQLLEGRLPTEEEENEFKLASDIKAIKETDG